MGTKSTKEVKASAKEMEPPKMFLERSDGILLLVVLGRYGGAGWWGVLALTSIMGPHGCVDSKEDTFMKTARRVFHVFVFGEVPG